MTNDLQSASIKLYIVLLISLCGLILCYSPLLGFCIPILFLILGLGSNFGARVGFTLVSILGAAFTFASRNYVSGTIKDDFANIYLPAFYDVNKGGTIFYESFSNGVEFFITLYFKVIGGIFGIKEPFMIMFAVLLFVLLLYYIWLELFVLVNIEKKYRSICVAACFSLLSCIIITQNMRQAISCVFLLYAISLLLNKKYIYCLVFTFLAVISHMTALIVLPLFYFIMEGSKKTRLIIIIVSLGFLLAFNIAIGIIISYNLLGASTYKLLYYADSTGRSVDIGYLKFLIISFFAALVLCKNDSVQSNRFRNLLFCGTILYLIFMPIPTLSFRFLMLLVVFYNGLTMFYAFTKQLTILGFLLIAYNLYKIYSLGPNQDLLTGPEAYMNLWYSYPWAGTEFLYYFK
ncbi:TPA: EpsG family protein [Klebsiella quasipneumoniae subsp. similipneumoniae]|uniref:EpsG family protein n=1 Tax=Klebsiella quasipneumoniae TaxID=1463165 RepID=UPI0022AAA53D|nr:EpsG family protein [Klebsiella quasipneumoniae]EIY4988338.1 EpsG family protein [Klebsiella quasipneumoniae]EIY5073682.1 EpsG family protein [Klebsiella quasipneumoniae]MEB6597319.1 EpsG family protein [Klebsiella quasipneumoniae]WAT47014.1 EpsG family protein [Klebsiella quasipneumoniae]HCC2618129.1 EpsG family protein [Klebsiella quasipneumoniae]